MSLDVMYHQYSTPTYINSTPQSTAYEQIYSKMQESTSALTHSRGGIEERSKAAANISGLGAFSLHGSNPFNMNPVGSHFQFPFRSTFHSPGDLKAGSVGNLALTKSKMDDRIGQFTPGAFTIPRAKPAAPAANIDNAYGGKDDAIDKGEVGAETAPPRASCSRLAHPEPKPTESRFDAPINYSVACLRNSSAAKPCQNPAENHRVANPTFGGDTVRKEPATHYVNSRCVMYDYFDGDISQEVDEHFTRALSQNTKAKDLPSPMNQRNFPASFWNSEYKAPSFQPSPYPGLAYDVMKGIPSPFTSLYGSASTSSLHCRSDLSPLDPFSATNNLTAFHNRLNSAVASDPWRVYAGGLGAFSSQNSYSQQALNAAVAASDLYGLTASASHTLDPRFGSLFAQPNSAAVELARIRAGNSVASLAAGLTSPAADLGKDPMGLWNTTRCPAFRF